MRSAVRGLLAVVAGMALAFALVVAVEFFSSIVHPFPADFDGNIPAHVKRYPHWVLAVFVACLLGIRLGGPVPLPAAGPDAARRSG